MTIDWYNWRRIVVNALRDEHGRFDITERDDFDRRAWIAWAADEDSLVFAAELVKSVTP